MIVCHIIEQNKRHLIFIYFRQLQVGGSLGHSSIGGQNEFSLSERQKMN